MADLPCPNCGSPLSFLEQYQRHYCLRCGQYAPEGYGDRGAKRCATCGGILSFVTQYNRFYCYHCNTYAQEEPATPAKAEVTAVTLPASPAVSTAAAPAEPESKPTPAASVAALSSAATPASTERAAEPSPAPANAPPTQAEAKPSETSTAASMTSEPTSLPQPAEPAPSEPSKEILALAASKPAVVRVKIFALKKSELIDLCKAYNLDPSGTKEQVQERLLSYLHDLEAEEQPEPETRVETAAPTVEPHPEPAPGPEPVTPPPAQTTAAAATSAVVATQPLAASPEEPETAEAVAGPTPAVAEVERQPAKAVHPCPTCGRELTYIAQYDRYYCYACQRYAPMTRVKGACPTCGATMRWIDEHQRWWCDSCQKYAPADLPKPTNATASVARAAATGTSSVASRPAILVHHHASPALGIGLVAAGIALWVLYEFFAVINPILNLGINNPFDPTLGAFMVFFSYLLLAAGVMVGLSSLRDRI